MWFLEPPESRFEVFLAHDPKLLPERLKNIARDLFLSLKRISGFWNLQKSVLKHFWFLAQNYCQNGSKTWRATYFWVWTEYLVFATSRKPFEAFLVPGPKLLSERLKNIARELFLDLDRIFGFWNLQKSF